MEGIRGAKSRWVKQRYAPNPYLFSLSNIIFCQNMCSTLLKKSKIIKGGLGGCPAIFGHRSAPPLPPLGFFHLHSLLHAHEEQGQGKNLMVTLFFTLHSPCPCLQHFQSIHSPLGIFLSLIHLVAHLWGHLGGNPCKGWQNCHQGGRPVPYSGAFGTLLSLSPTHLCPCEAHAHTTSIFTSKSWSSTPPLSFVLHSMSIFA